MPRNKGGPISYIALIKSNTNQSRLEVPIGAAKYKEILPNKINPPPDQKETREKKQLMPRKKENNKTIETHTPSTKTIQRAECAHPGPENENLRFSKNHQQGQDTQILPHNDRVWQTTEVKKNPHSSNFRANKKKNHAPSHNKYLQ